jgi:hypothetical protein
LRDRLLSFGATSLIRVPRREGPDALQIKINPKTETDLTTDYADYTDAKGYDWRHPEVLPRKDSYVSTITSSKSVETVALISESGLIRN